MTPPAAGRTQECGREQARVRLAQAQAFLEVADLIGDDPDELATPNVAAALAVLAGIAAADAACCVCPRPPLTRPRPPSGRPERWSTAPTDCSEASDRSPAVDSPDRFTAAGASDHVEVPRPEPPRAGRVPQPRQPASRRVRLDGARCDPKQLGRGPGRDPALMDRVPRGRCPSGREQLVDVVREDRPGTVRRAA